MWITVTNTNWNPGSRRKWHGSDGRDLTSREEVWADEVAAVSISEVVEDTVSVSLQKEKYSISVSDPHSQCRSGSSRPKSTRIHADPKHWVKEEVTKIRQNFRIYKKYDYGTTAWIEYGTSAVFQVENQPGLRIRLGSVPGTGTELLDQDSFTEFESGARWVPSNFENTGDSYHNQWAGSKSRLGPDPVPIDIIRL